jgi:glutaminyl-tRNA synthetase
MANYVLEHCLRKDLDNVCKRTLAVIDPVVVNLTNLKDDYSLKIEALDFPRDGKEKGTHEICLTNKIYVDREDVRLVDNKEFFGLAPGKLVGLRYTYCIKVDKVTTDNDGNVKEVFAEVLF